MLLKRNYRVQNVAFLCEVIKICFHYELACSTGMKMITREWKSPHEKTCYLQTRAMYRPYNYIRIYIYTAFCSTIPFM